MRKEALAVLRSIRESEIQMVVNYARPGSCILEIGAGAGWQARYLTGLGFRVIPMDVVGNHYASAEDWPVLVYDGTNIPLRNQSVDLVFSSNVLEHVAHVEALQAELHRVLKPDGRAIHLLPTPSWRFWTSVAMYPAAIRKVWRRLIAGDSEPSGVTDQAVKPGMPAHSSQPDYWWRHLPGNLWPVRHGERGNTVKELYYFSKRYWVKVFESTGWTVEWVRPNSLFYTGMFLLGTQPNLKMRRRLATFLGSACLVYALRPDRTEHR